MQLCYLNTGDDIPCGFLIVEKGECFRLKDVWSVNLICARDKSKKNKKGLGQILMGLYLFTIHFNPIIHDKDKYGILELANSYLNVAGLASYSKLGFDADEDLWGDNCFHDYNNLPMSTQNKINPDKIINILNNLDTGYPKPQICNLRGNIQIYLGICKKLFNFIYNVPADQQNNYIKEIANVNFKILKNVLTDEFQKTNHNKFILNNFKPWFINLIQSIESNPDKIPIGFDEFNTFFKATNPPPKNKNKLVENIKDILQKVYKAKNIAKKSKITVKPLKSKQSKRTRQRSKQLTRIYKDNPIASKKQRSETIVNQRITRSKKSRMTRINTNRAP